LYTYLTGKLSLSVRLSGTLFVGWHWQDSDSDYKFDEGIMDSTSVHSLNADKGLRRHKRLLWLAVNWLNNHFFPNASDRHLAIQDFIADISDEKWQQISVTSSPPRRLSDLFWLQLPWNRIELELRRINILDTGCGSGNYGVKLQSFSSGRIGSYTGFDLSWDDNWPVLMKENPGFQFFRLNSKGIVDSIPEDTNFFMSQSAIEHFEKDLRYFKNICKFIKDTSRSILQVHLFPSAACLKLYRFHGVRQYTPRTVSFITHLFKSFSYSVLFRLGGRRCNSLHWEFITKPIFIQRMGDLRDSRTHEYETKLRQAIAADNEMPHLEPSFYALVIHSNYREAIFK
jgi:hypothetical protein